ncbi:PAS domain S-box-containing protein [Cohnella sp. OV330]|uniref:sensor histidine kinase n=1 Tax=Cohnella sp. OV330 TaxID=1855288 RepID=UPI0008F2D545|nr:MHYT domain-containing protein [Cohnella sp. OV330]SFB53769.1 PAS domain S-box-containing protein [Cohnella sp. OV330]
MTELHGTYYTPLVVLSVLISVLSSYCSLLVYEHVLKLRGSYRNLWLLLGSTAMGFGIWSMHFIGMLAYHLPVDIRYHPGWLAISILLPVLAVYAAFRMMARNLASNLSMAIGSFWLCVAIVGMHYSGMAAIRMPYDQRYDWLLVAASIGIAFAVSFAALKLSHANQQKGQAPSQGAKMLLSLLLGAAIAGMHYTGMAAVSFAGTEAEAAHVRETTERMQAGNALLAAIIGGSMLFIFVLVVASQILDKRLALRIADSSQRRYDSIFEHHPDMVCLYDPSGRILKANPAAERIMGYAASELPSRFHKEMVNPEEFEQLEACFMAALRGESGTVEVTVRHKAGHLLHLSCTMVPWVEDGRVQDIYTISKDITGSVETERQLLAAKRDAEEALRVKSDFLAVMSHEIRTPLNGVIGMSSILLETELSEEQQEFVQVIQGSGALLLSTINDVLDYSKLEAGKMQLSIAPFSLHGLVRDTAMLFQTQCKQKGLELACAVEEGMTDAVLGDEQRICQVLINLVGNAVKFTAKGGIEVAVHPAGHGVEEAGQRVRFEVRDTGIGIPGEELEHLFQPFYQAKNGRAKRHEGTGLGLAICKDLVDMMGGTISVTSAVGEGTCFVFELPLEAASFEGPNA